MLLDFYGELLTERQKQTMQLYYEEDLSLGEIAEQLRITRAGVHDALKRGLAALEHFEKRLGLLARFVERDAKLDELQRLLLNALETIDALRI